MLAITDSASEQLVPYMQESGGGKAVRIKLQSGG